MPIRTGQECPIGMSNMNPSDEPPYGSESPPTLKVFADFSLILWQMESNDVTLDYKLPNYYVRIFLAMTTPNRLWYN